MPDRLRVPSFFLFVLGLEILHGRADIKLVHPRVTQLDDGLRNHTSNGARSVMAEARLFAAQGAKVVANDIAVKTGEPLAQTVVDEIRAAGSKAVANTGSVAEVQGTKRLVQTALAAFGRLDILVNNAGMTNFISSKAGLGRVFGMNYSAAKEGLIGLTRAVAKELGRVQRVLQRDPSAGRQHDDCRRH